MGTKIYIDDLSRTERYYTATLLPYLLLYNNFEGVLKFLRWLENKKVYALDAISDTPCSLGARQRISHIELITEMDIVRDVKFYSRFIPGLRSINTNKAPSLRPDIVILTNSLVLVIEAKFFHNVNSVNDIRNQLSEQKKVIKSILLNFPGYSFDRYSQIFLAERTGFSEQDLNCQGVLTWSDIRDFSLELLGKSHYVSKRLARAVQMYSATNQYSSDSNTDSVNYVSKLPFGEIIRKIEDVGDDIIIGFQGGISELWLANLEALRKRKYKWDYREKPIGKKNPENWILGTNFLSVIKSKMGEGYPEPAINYRFAESSAQAIGNNYRGKLSLEGIVRKCQKEGDKIVIGYYGGLKKLKQASPSELRNRKAYKWDWENSPILPKQWKNWISCSDFLEVVFEKIPSLKHY